MQMLEVLDKSLKTIHPDKIKIDNNALRQKIVEAYHASKARDHVRILSRHKIIEDRKEYLEKLNEAKFEGEYDFDKANEEFKEVLEKLQVRFLTVLF